MIGHPVLSKIGDAYNMGDIGEGLNQDMATQYGEQQQAEQQEGGVSIPGNNWDSLPGKTSGGKLTRLAREKKGT